MKKFIAVVISLFLVLSLVACGKNVKRPKPSDEPISKKNVDTTNEVNEDNNTKDETKDVDEDNNNEEDEEDELVTEDEDEPITDDEDTDDSYDPNVLNAVESNVVSEKGEDLAKLILLSKSLFKIENFYTDVSVFNYDENKSVSWSFDDYTDYIYVRAEYNKYNEPINFSKSYTTQAFSPLNISVKKAKRLADDFISKAYKSVSNIDSIRFYSSDLGMDTLNLKYQIYHDELPVVGAYLTISYDKLSGEMVGLNLTKIGEIVLHSDISDDFSAYKDKDPSKFFDSNPLLLFLGKGVEDNYIPYYTLSFPSYYVKIDDGKPIEIQFLYNDLKTDSISEKGKNMSGLTEVEKKEVLKVDSLHSRDEALEMSFEAFGKKINEATHVHLLKSSEKDYYKYNINYDAENDSTSTSIRATDLLPVYYSHSIYDVDNLRPLTSEEKAKFDDEIDAFKQKFIPYYHEYKEVKTINSDDLYRVMYYKYIDDYLIDDDYFVFDYNSYGLNFYEFQRDDRKINYAPKKILEKEAEDVMAKSYDLAVRLMPEIEDDTLIKLVPVFGFDNASPKISAISGNKLAIDKKLVEPIYKSKRDRKIIEDLISYGFGVTETKGMEDEFTKKDLLYNVAKFNFNDYYSEKRLLKLYGMNSSELDEVATLQDVLDVFVLNKLNIKELDDSLFTKINDNEIKGHRGIFNMAYQFGWVEDDDDPIKELTVKDALSKVLPKIIFNFHK